MKRIMAMVFCVLLTLGLIANVWAGSKPKKIGIVIAAFGTTYPKALHALLNVQNKIQQTFPTAKVKMAFTSNIIRRIWQKRQNDPKWTVRTDIPKEIFYVKTPLATIADLQNQGYKTIIVQPTHFFMGEEYLDLRSYIDGLNSIKTIKKKWMPFDKLVLSRPLTGCWGVEHDYHEDLEKTARALKPDVELAKSKNAALVYMGHGNEFFSTGIYIELQTLMRKIYPGVKIFIGTVEGFPSLDDVLAGLKHAKVKKVVLKPLMMVAGDHANNDMAGPDKDSWKSQIEAQGIKVYPVLKGLGENPKVVEIFVEHIKDTIKDHHIAMP